MDRQANENASNQNIQPPSRQGAQDDRPIMPGFKKPYVRPGIDDRPDWNKALSEEEKSAVDRLAVPQASNEGPSAASQAEVQAAAFESTSPVGGLDAPIPNAESAFLDLRDPMVDAEGYRPTTVEIVRMKIGFMLTALFLAFAASSLNIVLVPERLQQLCGTLEGGDSLAWIIGVGLVLTVLVNATLQPLSDRTRTLFGRRTPWFLGGAFVATLFGGCLSACHTDVALGLVWALVQIGFAVMLFAFSASIGERVPDKFRDAVASWRVAGMSVGMLLGAAFGAFLMAHATWGMEVCAGMFLLAALAFLFVVPRETSTVYMGVKHVSAQDILQSFHVKGAPRSWYLACAIRLLAAASIQVTITFLWFLVYTIKGVSKPLSLRDTMFIVAGIAFVAFVFAFIAGAMLRSVYARWGVGGRIPAIVACVVIVAATACAWWIPNIVGLLLFAALSGFSMTMLEDLSQAIALNTIPQIRDAAGYLAVLNTVNVCGKLIAVIVGGIVVGCTGQFRPLFVVAAIFAAITILFAAFLKMRRA